MGGDLKKIGTRLSLILIVFTLLIMVLIALLVFFDVRKTLFEGIRTRLKDYASLAAARIPGDVHALLRTEEDMKTPAYSHLETFARMCKGL